MSLDHILAGGGLEEIFFWSFGSFIMFMGVLDTIITPRNRDYEE